MSRLPYCFKTKALCVKTIKVTVRRHNYSRWRRPGNLKVKISDFKVHFCRSKHFFGENCRAKLIANILLGLKLFISGEWRFSLKFCEKVNNRPNVILNGWFPRYLTVAILVNKSKRSLFFQQQFSLHHCYVSLEIGCKPLIQISRG